MMKRLVVVIGILFLLIFTPTVAQDVPTFEAVDCPTEARLPAAFHCGYLTVLADRENPSDGTLKLMVAIYHTDRKDLQPDPLIYLNGGPGEPTVIGGRGVMRVFGNFSDRDIILFDQRGTGYSEPNTTCPEVDAAFYDGMDQNLSAEDRQASNMEALHACYDRLIQSGVNPAWFNSAASAADVQDLRTALGYDEINLYGISYGTRLALTIMRDHPEGIRSVILDSVFPPNVDAMLDSAPRMQEIFDKVIAACNADSTCSDKYPDLETALYTVVDQLNAEPVTIQAAGHTLHVDGDTFMIALFGYLYNATAIPTVPGLIYKLRDGDASGLNPLVQLLLPRSWSGQGMAYSIGCYEETPFSDTARLADVQSTLKPTLQTWMQQFVQGDTTVCDFWKTSPPNPIEKEAVVSDIPTLVLAGEFDPVTPPRYAQLAASTLSHSYQVEVPATGHGAMLGNVSLCAVVVAEGFLADPTTTPENTCPTSMPIPFK